MSRKAPYPLACLLVVVLGGSDGSWDDIRGNCTEAEEIDNSSTLASDKHFSLLDIHTAGGASELWQFSRDDCLEGVFPNTGAENLFGAIRRTDMARTSCLTGRGVRALPNLGRHAGVLLESDKNLSGVTDLLPVGISVELWGDFGAHPYVKDVRVPIFTIGQVQSAQARNCMWIDEPAQAMSVQLIAEKSWFTGEKTLYWVGADTYDWCGLPNGWPMGYSNCVEYRTYEDSAGVGCPVL